jgi:L-methionine (R)-S-oxide reductase
MAESLFIPQTASKAERYEALIPQIKALTESESDLIANLSNLVAALHHSMGFFWTGFYLVKNGELVLGPFQGPIACTRIAKGKGVCGSSWAQAASILVPNVDEFPGHIACSSDSKSEIVVPVFKNGEVVAVLDVDSAELNTYDAIDQQYLEELMEVVGRWF